MEDITNNFKNPIPAPENISLDDLDISIRLYQVLRSKNILTLKDIVNHPKSYFTDKNGFIKYSLKELEEVVKNNNLEFKPEENI